MADISIQFHALPEELFAFVKQCVADFHLHVVAMRFFPFEAIEISPDKLDDIFLDSSPYEELGLTLRKPSLPVKTQLDYYDKNPDSLRLDIKRKRANGLEQTWLCARTDDVDALMVWRRIAKQLRGMTQAGVVGIDAVTGGTAFYRSFRFTPGAKALEANGVPMVPFAGGCLLKLGMPAGEEKKGKKRGRGKKGDADRFS